MQYNYLKMYTSMKETFQDWFENHIKTQYGDMKGIAYLDGHNGPSDIKKMIEKCQIDNFNLEEYVVLGFNIYGFEPIGKTIHATLLATQKTTLSIRGNINNLNYDSDVQEFSIENCSWDFLGTYIKRLSVGVILPDYHRK